MTLLNFDTVRFMVQIYYTHYLIAVLLMIYHPESYKGRWASPSSLLV